MLLSSHPIEQKMGILYYSTNTNGIGGNLRSTPLDFRVEEIQPDNRIIQIEDKDFSFGENEPGLFTEFVLVKKNIESHRALMKITSALGRKLEDINIAGTKDKMAYTAQRATIWRVPSETLLSLQIKDIKIRAPRTTIYQTYLGNLKGNHFTIRIRKLDFAREELSDKIESIFKEISKFNGLANFFGHQRFGSRRPVSHIIGKYILHGEIKEALQFYLSYISDDESDLMKETRKIFVETNDPFETLKVLPRIMVFERAILKYLVKHPNDFKGAFYTLPKNLQRMFVHAYQSYIWNRTLSERMRLYDDLKPQEIDIVKEGKIVLPILGFKTELPDNVLYDHSKMLLEEDNIKLEDFVVTAIPTLKFSGSYRSMILEPGNFSYGIEKDNEGDDVVITKFSLPSGSYATVVLREFMKCTPIKF